MKGMIATANNELLPENCFLGCRVTGPSKKNMLLRLQSRPENI